MDKPSPPVWFVTGAASGFGRAIVEYVVAQGCPVVATARDPSRLDDLVAAHPDRVLALPLDVTAPDQARAAVAEAERRFGSLDVLVNNAGYGLVAAVEEADDAEVRQLFETHLFGMVVLLKAALPGMRERGRGHVMNFSSTAGVAGTLGIGYYAAVKAAVEGLSDSLAYELAPFGLKVTVVEPGPFQTGFFEHPSRTSRGRMEAYASTVGAYRQMASGPRELPGDPARAAKALFDIALTAEPPLRLLLGRFAYDYAVGEYRRRLEEAERWKELTLSADFPEWQGRKWP